MAATLSALLAFPPVAYAAPVTVYVHADIVTDTTWSADNTYVILKRPEGSVAYNPEVKPGVTLTIEPGARIVFGTGTVVLGEDEYDRADGLKVAGHIRALGTSDAKITFTSGTTWDRIELKQTSADHPVDAVFQHCVFEHGTTMIDIQEGFPEDGSDIDVSVSNCLFESPAALDNYRKGIAIYSSLGDRTASRGTLSVIDSTFSGLSTAIWYHNQTVERDDDVDITIDGCTFTNNGHVGWVVDPNEGSIFVERSPVVIQGGDAIRLTGNSFANYPSETQPAVLFGYHWAGANWPRSANLWGNDFYGHGSAATPPVLYRQGMRINDDAIAGSPNTYSGYAAGALYATFVVPNSGTEDADAHWGPVGLDYRITEQVTVGRRPTEANPNAGSLTVGAGTTVRLAEGGSVAVNSALDALGTAENPVTFTGYDGGTIGFLDYHGESTFRHAIFEHMLEGLVFYGMDDAYSPETLVIEDCIFRDNVQSGLIFYGPGAGTISTSIFEDNGLNGFTSSASAADEQRLVFDGCTFRNNSGTGVTAASTYGLAFRNCLMHANGASGVYVENWRVYQSAGAADPEKYMHRFINCTIANNTGHGIESSDQNAFSAWYVSSSILSGNAAGDVGADASTVGGIVYSSVSSADDEPLLGWESIVADPLFADAASGDFHLKSQAGRWNGSTWVTDATTSPCVNAGDPRLAYANEHAPNGGRINMGVYGGTPEASKADGVTPPGTVFGLTAVSTGSNSIALGWTANPSAEGYEIRRTESALQEDYWVNPNISPWIGGEVIATVAGTVDGLEDTDVWGGQYYYYTIREYSTLGDTRIYGGYSPLAVATPVPSAPHSISAMAESASRIRVTWDSVPGAYWYRVWYRPVGAATWDYTAPLTASEFDSRTAWFHEGLAPNTAYEYWVEGAYSSWRQYIGYTYYWGDDSEVVSATTPSGIGAPELAPIEDAYLDELTTLTFSASATGDGAIVYSLVGAPSGATIDPSSGAFTWTPTEAQGPGTYYITVKASVGAAYESRTARVRVYEDNVPCELNPIGNQTVVVGHELRFTASVTDYDIPAQGLEFELDAGAPDGATIDPTAGVFTWTPTADQVGEHTVVVRVSDGAYWKTEFGWFEAWDSETITITVVSDGDEVNEPPILAAIGNKTVAELSKLTFTATATDPDLPAQALTFSLGAGAPLGASITGAGVFTWTPTEAQGPGTYPITVVVSDGTLTDSETITVTVTEVPDALVVSPIEGRNRITTAIAASAEAFPEGADWVVIATGFNWPDALGGAALAGAVEGPILLTAKDVLPNEVRAEITRLGATHAYILGGTPAVSSAVEDALKASLGAGNVKRVSGNDRYATARAIAAETVQVLGPSYDGTCFIATGANFPDALGASPLAAAKGWPIYLVNPARPLDSGTKTAMAAVGVDEPIILGSANAVPAGIETSLDSIYGAPVVKRWFGGDRYSTAVEIAKQGVAAGLTWDKVAFATGTNFPDALAGGVLQGLDGSVMLLTPGTTLNSTVRQTLVTNKAGIHEVRYLGSTDAISQGVRDSIQKALQ